MNRRPLEVWAVVSSVVKEWKVTGLSKGVALSACEIIVLPLSSYLVVGAQMQEEREWAQAMFNQVATDKRAKGRGVEMHVTVDTVMDLRLELGREKMRLGSGKD